VKDIKLNHKASKQPVVKCTLPRGAFLV
jgi:hypothetical protein